MWNDLSFAKFAKGGQPVSVIRALFSAWFTFTRVRRLPQFASHQVRLLRKDLICIEIVTH